MLVLAVIMGGSSFAGAGQPVAPGAPRGEYVVPENVEDCDLPESTTSSFCPEFVENLNGFRHLDFAACEPHLSPAYPAFSRPAWAAIPFDIGLVEQIIPSCKELTISAPLSSAHRRIVRWGIGVRVIPFGIGRQLLVVSVSAWHSTENSSDRRNRSQ